MPQLPQTLPDLGRSRLSCYYSFMWEASPEGMLGFALERQLTASVGFLQFVFAGCFEHPM